MKIPNPLGRRWWFPTLFVIAGVYVLIQLGFWQLDRLQQRRDYNQFVASRWDQEPFDLTDNPLPADLSNLEYRRVELTGDYDYANQIVLKNQFRAQEPGVNLVTPLLLADGRAILVARGWVPLSQSTPDAWPQFEADAGEPIVGMLQESQTLAGAKAPEAPQTEWFRVDIDAIQQQLPYELLPVFITQLPEPGRGFEDLPYREIPFEITEGNHFSYALQWFSFALILGVGYIQYMLYTERHRTAPAGQKPQQAAPDESLPVDPDGQTV
ncbi:MAG TPA: SURF1 family protein [Caldilineaceae bacterium]|nr:SURF1 family protein [Caldilineaceae bacterium]